MNFKRIYIFILNHEDNTYCSLKMHMNYCIKKKCIGIITLPIKKRFNKKKLLIINFIGHTEFFQKLENKNI